MPNPSPPPTSIAWTVELWAPGIYQDFITRIVTGLQGQRVNVTSWWRDPWRNRAVGGHPDSQHLIGLAADFVFPADEWQQARSRLSRTGLVVVDEGDHVHTQVWPSGVTRSSGLLSALGL